MSEAGFKVSKQEIQAVLDFPLPNVGKQLESFLGTVICLRHLKRYLQTFHDLIANYDKYRKIVWLQKQI